MLKYDYFFCFFYNMNFAEFFYFFFRKIRQVKKKIVTVWYNIAILIKIFVTVVITTVSTILTF